MVSVQDFHARGPGFKSQPQRMDFSNVPKSCHTQSKSYRTGGKPLAIPAVAPLGLALGGRAIAINLKR